MKVRFELELRTREVYQLFERRINGDRLFIETILHKFNIVLNRCRQRDPLALASYKKIENTVVGFTQQFTDEITRLETMLTKKKDFAATKINYITKYRPVIIVTTPLSIQFIEFIEIYDKLIATLKLLQLVGCFESNDIFWNNTKRYQKIANQALSNLMAEPKTIEPDKKATG